MTLYKYIGADTRYYPSFALTAEPGVTADLPEAPGDGRWQVAEPAQVKTAPVSETPGMAVSEVPA